MSVVLVGVLGFVLGAVPFAMLVVRLCKGVDVRTIGSGNPGATNASRAFTTKGGRLAAFLGIYLLDAAKGFVPAMCGPRMVATDDPLAVGVLAGSSAVLGHVFSPFLGGRGGKGVATATGALLALDWQVTVIGIVVFGVVRAATGHVFLGSLALALALPAGAVLLHADTAFGARLPFTLACVLLAALLFWTHRSNLKKHFAARAAGSA